MVSKRESSEDETQTESLRWENEVLAREFEIKTLTKEKSEAEETINNLTKALKLYFKEKSEAAKESKLNAERLESEVAKLREELSKKV